MQTSQDRVFRAASPIPYTSADADTYLAPMPLRDLKKTLAMTPTLEGHEELVRSRTGRYGPAMLTDLGANLLGIQSWDSSKESALTAPESSA